jgi:predicted DNA-binding transcriptional regulator AlpA
MRSLPSSSPSSSLDDRLLTPQETARVLGVSRALVYSRRMQEALGAVRVFGAVRFRESAVRRAIEQGIRAVDQERGHE